MVRDQPRQKLWRPYLKNKLKAKELGCGSNGRTQASQALSSIPSVLEKKLPSLNYSVIAIEN
jgi:hypothetical protein